MGGAADTLITNAERDATVLPLLTLITIPASVPTSFAAGVPVKCPVALLKLIQLGLCAIKNRGVVPAAPLTDGVKVRFEGVPTQLDLAAFVVAFVKTSKWLHVIPLGVIISEIVADLEKLTTEETAA